MGVWEKLEVFLVWDWMLGILGGLLSLLRFLLFFDV